jgi:hypothetical protein
MKKFLAVVLLCLPVFGQAVYSGASHSSGPAIFSVASSDAPLTYAARTDNCITGAESGCVAGRTTGKAGSPLVFTTSDADPLPFQQISSGLANTNNCFTDPDFGTYECLVTDQNFQSNQQFELGDGGGNRFSTDETLFLIRNAGTVPYLVDVVPSRFRAHICAPTPSSSNCFVKSQIAGSGTPNSTHLDNNASVSMSRTEPMTLYERTDDQKLYKVVVTQPKDAEGTPTGLDTITRTLVVDFTSDTPVPCKVLPSDYHQTWSTGGSFTIGEGGGGSWATRSWNTGGTGLVTTDTFIRPVNNNPGGTTGNWMYQATTPGQTGTTEPNWAANCATKGSTCADGAVTWTNVGNIAGQGPAFDVVGYDPAAGHGCFHANTYTGRIFRGTGSSDPAGDMQTDDWPTSDRQANVATAGTGTRPTPMKDRFGLHAAGNSGDHYATFGPTMTPPIFPGGSCVDPGLKLNPSTGSGKWVTGTSYTYHDFVFGSDANWYDKKSAGTSSSTGNPTTDTTNWEVASTLCYGYIWDRYTLMVRPLIGVTAPTGVSGGGFSTDQHNIGGRLYTYRGGKYFQHSYARPVCDAVNNPSGCLYEGAANPGMATVTGAGCNDAHPSTNNFDSLDRQPAFFPHADVPSWPTNYSCSSYMEETALAMDGSGTEWRFGHNWNTGSSTNFSIQNAIGTISPMGDLFAYTSDFMGSRGDANSGATTCAHKLRGMYQPTASQTVTYLDTLLPIGNNAALNVFQVTGCGANTPGATCTLASTLPAWGSACTTTCTSGGATITNLGPNTCRGDVAVMDVLSAHPAPEKEEYLTRTHPNRVGLPFDGQDRALAQPRCRRVSDEVTLVDWLSAY